MIIQKSNQLKVMTCLNYLNHYNNACFDPEIVTHFLQKLIETLKF